jgi:AraC-like DNA-binding protein
MDPIRLYERKHQESYAVRAHHHNNYQILYAIEGRGVLELEGVRYELEQDCAAVVFPYANHAVSSDSNLTLLVLEFEESLFEDRVAAHWNEQYIRTSVLLRLSLFHANELRRLLRKLLFEQQQTHGASRWAMHVYWLEVLLLLSQAKLAAPVADANALRAERMRKYIDSHYYEPLTSNDLAYKLGISARHATNIFKEKYHMTPMHYLAEVRMGVAKKLLSETDKHIISISFEVGYESLPTFYRVFKSFALMSPSKYRQQYRSE